MKRARFAETLQALAHQQVEFIVVGMAAGVLQGVPLTTLDIDIVHRRTPENVARLLGVLSALKAVVRVLELTMLLEVKRRAGRPKDLAVLPFLEATIAEIAKNG